MKLCSTGLGAQPHEGEKRCLNSELWHACAGPLVSLPVVGSRVVYFPQGHSEQVAASTNKEADSHIPNYPSLPPQLICQLHDVTMHADVESDEVYAQMTLQPLNPQEQNDVYFAAELGTQSKQPTNYFCKTLTASDTSTHGGFSVPRRAAEKVFPPLDFSQSPPAQELVARDLHGNEWKFRHIFRGQPKRHLLTTGWSVFVSAKRLVAGDSVLFIWNENNQLLLGIRRSNRPQTVMPSSVLSSDSMHIGLLAAAAHAAATNSRFTIFYNPRASPSEFVIPLTKYVKSVCHTRVSVGMRFRMLFETEESSVRRYMGTITGIGDLDPLRWPNSHWRSVKVGWDESTAGERQPRVSLWEIEPLTTFPMYPPPFPLRLKRPWLPGFASLHAGKVGDDFGLNNTLMWLRESERGAVQPCLSFQGGAGSSSPWIQGRVDASFLGVQPDLYHQPAASAADLQQQVLHQFPPPQPSSQHSSFLQGLQDGPAHHPMPGQPPPSPHFLQPHLHLHHQSATSSYAAEQHKIQLPPPFLPEPLPPFSVAASSGVSPLHGILGGCFPPEVATQLLNPQSWSNKRAAVELSTPPSCSPGGDCSVDQEDTTDSQSNILFGVNIDQTSLLGDNPAVVFGSMGCGSGTETDQLPSPNPLMASGCLDESPAFLQVKPQDGTFVKVYKSGSFGRLLDITRFNNYPELRSELGRMFGLEGQLEDPLRSGWQLVFVDREGDVLLVGDDPWQEFVNSVWCIKILSSLEVQRMGKQGPGPPVKGLPSAGGGGDFDDYVNRRPVSRGGLGTGIMSVGAFDY